MEFFCRYMLLNSLFDTLNLTLVTRFSCLIQIGSNSNKFDKKLSLLQTYLLVACTMQRRSLFSPSTGACGTKPKSQTLLHVRKIIFQRTQYPLVEFTFQKTFYSPWSFTIPAHCSVVNSKDMGHGLKQNSAKANAASWTAPLQLHE